MSLFGGVGTILGAFLGSLLIAEVSNGMNVIGVDSYWQSLVIGVIILLGVLFDTNKNSFRGRMRKRQASKQREKVQQIKKMPSGM